MTVANRLVKYALSNLLSEKWAIHGARTFVVEHRAAIIEVIRANDNPSIVEERNLCVAEMREIFVDPNPVVGIPVIGASLNPLVYEEIIIPGKQDADIRPTTGRGDQPRDDGIV